jgi:ATP-binding cassette subfamily B protein
VADTDDAHAIGPTTTAPQTAATMQLFWSVARCTPWRLAISLVMPVITVLSAGFLGPLIIAALLDRIQQGEVTLADSAGLIAAYAGTQIFGHVIGWRITLYVMWTAVLRGMRRLYQRVFDHLTEQSLAFHADRFSGALVSQTNKLTGAYDLFAETVVWQIIPVTTTVIAAVAILSFVLWPYAVFLALMCLLFVGAVLLSRPKLERLNVAEAQASTRMTGFLADVMTNISAVKAHGSEEAERRGAREVSDRWVDADLRVMRTFLGYSTGFSTVMALTNIGAVVAAVLAAQYGAIDIPGIYLAVTYTLVVTDNLWQVNQIMRNYNKILGDAHDMVEILNSPPAVTDSTRQALRPGPGQVRFEQVRFAHDGTRGDPLFDGFDLIIQPGERVGLVGHSGSGKTTLTRLLLRFSDVDGGRILIDGQDVREVSQGSLRRAIAYVPQEPLLFHRSLWDNIAYGKPEATDEEVRRAAAKAQALEFVESLPEGFATLVGERGVKLSGGQRQRIAIARAILKDAAILVLDEATSALDSESESQIQAALDEAMTGRTTVVIAHRLSTVASMDRIIVMAAGRIVEQGPPAQLLAAGGAYAALWRRQSGGFMA